MNERTKYLLRDHRADLEALADSELPAAPIAEKILSLASRDV